MENNVISFVEGYALGAEDAGNLKPLEVTKNGIYYPSDFNCMGFNQVDVHISDDATLIDNLPTLGEVIVDDVYSIKIKRSDEISYHSNNDFAFDAATNSFGDKITYLQRYWKTWTYYFCVYKSGKFVFCNAQNTHTSRQWSWSMWNSDVPWLNVYNGHTETELTSLNAQKSYDSRTNLSCVVIDIYYRFETFFIRYNIDGEIEESTTSKSVDIASKIVINSYSDVYFVESDYKKQANEIIQFGQAVTDSKILECKIYKV